MQYTHKMDYYSAFQSKKILIGGKDKLLVFIHDLVTFYGKHVASLYFSVPF